MATRRFSNIFVIILGFTMLAGCATRIGTQANIDEVVFTIGKTTKKEMADILGLPTVVETDKVSGVELWGYQNEPRRFHVFGPSVIAATLYTSDRFKEYNIAAKVFLFNKDGVLIEAKSNQKEKQ